MGKNGALVFSEKFGERTEAEQIVYLKKLTASQNTALDIMQKERNEWREKAQTWEQQVKNSQAALDIQKKINLDAITQHNADEQENHKRIAILERKLSEVGISAD